TLILFALWLVFQVVLAKAGGAIQAESGGASVLDLALAYSPDAAYANYLDKYSDAARSIYLKTECLDLLYPLCYGLFFACLLTAAWRGTNYLYLNIVPLIAIIFDYLENIGVFALLLSYPTHLPFMAAWASGFGTIKWALAAASLLLLLVGFGKKLVYQKNGL
ncbi:MAG: hypothetical protein RI894_1935, partial [Bacteroidota bacterium]